MDLLICEPFPLLCFFRILAANTLLPQQKPQQANPQQAAQPSSRAGPFGTNVNTVMEAVTVKDKNGKPIDGLTAKDFVVTEDNVPQTINFFEFQKMEDNVLPAIAAPTAAPITAAAEKEKPKVESAHARGNHARDAGGDLKYRDRRLLALYFDLTAMPVPDQLRAFDAAAEIHHQADEIGRSDGHHQVRWRGGARHAGLHRQSRRSAEADR